MNYDWDGPSAIMVEQWQGLAGVPFSSMLPSKISMSKVIRLYKHQSNSQHSQ
jgi:hypothetical protein